MKSAGTYVRVSTKLQDNAMQTDGIAQFCSAMNIPIVKQYSDKASGSRGDRAGLMELMSDAKKKLFNVVVVWRYDRFARSLRQLVDALGEFDAMGIDFVSIHENVNTATPQGKLVFGIFASLAEFERSLIGERTRAGMAHAAANGRFPGRPLKIGDRRKVRELRECGEPLRKIALQTGFSLGTVRTIVRQAGLPSGRI